MEKESKDVTYKIRAYNSTEREKSTKIEIKKIY